MKISHSLFLCMLFLMTLAFIGCNGTSPSASAADTTDNTQADDTNPDNQQPDDSSEPVDPTDPPSPPPSDDDNQPQDDNADYNIEQTLSDQAQKNTIAFDALAFLTGDLCADSFYPPGKVSDFCGFQYLRDNDQDGMGHNTDFVPRIANNVLYILTDDQVNQLIELAQTQVSQMNEYAYMRFPIMQAFRDNLNGDFPQGTTELDIEAVREYSAQLYKLDGQISYQRAQVFGNMIRSLDQDQLTYLEGLATGGMLSWPELPDQVDPQSMPPDEHVAVMTYAGQIFSWYAGSVVADTYFCPERQGTCFGSFYLKDISAMGNPDYSIDEDLTGRSGEAFLEVLTEDQAKQITDLVDIQRETLEELVETRRQIATLLRKFLSSDTADEEAVLALAEKYGELDGEIVYYYATHFSDVSQTLTTQQQEELMTLRKLDDYPCSGAYLYSENIEMPEIDDSVNLFK